MLRRTFYPREDDRVRHGQLDDQVQALVLEQGVKQLGLRRLAWEAIEDEVVALESEQARRDQLEHSLVGQQACRGTGRHRPSAHGSAWYARARGPEEVKPESSKRTSSLHDCLCLLAEFCAVADLGAEEVARDDAVDVGVACDGREANRVGPLYKSSNSIIQITYVLVGGRPEFPCPRPVKRG